MLPHCIDRVEEKHNPHIRHATTLANLVNTPAYSRDKYWATKSPNTLAWSTSPSDTTDWQTD